MNVHMYEAAATQENLSTLARRGARIVEAGSGYLACGDVGRGRLAEIEDIVDCVLETLEGDARRDLEGMHVLVTAGPTEEPIDPVRFITNRAKVTLVSGPVALDAPVGVVRVPVRTACEMLESASDPFERCDIAVFTAAVADMRPAAPFDHKLKKSSSDDADLLSRIELVENPDILATLAARKRDDQIVVGFAAETDDVVANAQRKLASKHVDFIVANRVGEGVAFGTDDNQATLVLVDGSVGLPLMSKRELADRILDQALSLRGSTRS